MAFEKKVGTFATNAGSGNQSVTGLGFQPSFLALFGNSLTATGTSTDSIIFLGFAASASDEVCCAASNQDTIGTNGGYRHENAFTLYRLSNAGVKLRSGAVQSFDADGFTINLAEAGGTQIVSYWAIGGSDVTNAGSIEFATPTSGTPPFTTAYTGMGFEPGVVIFVAPYVGTQAPTGNTNIERMTLGFATASDDWGSYNGSRMNSPFTKYKRSSASSSLIVSDASGTLADAANISTGGSLDADGFTLQYTTSNGTARYVFAIGLKGPQFKVGSFQTPNSATTKAVTGVGFQPESLLMTSTNAPTLDTTTTNSSIRVIGAATGTTERTSIWTGKNSGNAGDHALDTANAYLSYVPGTPALFERADLQSFDSDGFTLDFDTANGTMVHVGYLAAAAASTGGLPKNVGEGGYFNPAAPWPSDLLMKGLQG